MEQTSEPAQQMEALFDRILAKIDDSTDYEKLVYGRTSRLGFDERKKISYRELKEIVTESQLERLLHARKVIRRKRMSEAAFLKQASESASEREDLSFTAAAQLERNPASFFAYEESADKKNTAVYFLCYDTLEQRTQMKAAFALLAKACFIRQDDHIVVDMLDTTQSQVNLWRDHSNEIYEQYHPPILLSCNIPQLFGYEPFYYSAKKPVLELGDYIIVAAELIRYEDAVLIGKQAQRTPRQFCEGVLQYYFDLRMTANLSLQLPRLFMLIDALHLETGTVAEFCKAKRLHYAVLDRSRI